MFNHYKTCPLRNITLHTTLSTQYQKDNSLYSISKPVAAIVTDTFNLSAKSFLVEYVGRSIRLKQVLKNKQKSKKIVLKLL